MFYNLLLSISVTIHFFYFFFYRCPESPCRMIILNRQAVRLSRSIICVFVFVCVAEDRAEA